MNRKREERRTDVLNSRFSDMPFTPAHAAWLFPLRRIDKANISWTALFIGTMVPDLEYFIWLSPAAYNSHSLEGVFLFNLPMTFILSFIWHHTLVKALLPRLAFLRSDFKPERYPDFIEWLKNKPIAFILSALVGIFSHLIWDSFSHANGYLAHKIPFLIDESIVGGIKIRHCYIVWYVSTFVGLLVMAYWMISIKKIFNRETWKLLFKGSSFWGKIMFAAGLIAVSRIALGLSWNWTRHLVIITIGSLFYATILVCYLDRWMVNKKEKAGPLS